MDSHGLRLPGLPTETLLEILPYCSDGALAAFALTNRAFQCLAEQLLYHMITLESSPGSSASLERCLKTLATYSWKASLVRSFSLSVRHDDEEMEPPQLSQLAHLSKSLIQMSELQHLRLHFYRVQQRLCTNLNNALPRCTFFLTTLSISRYVSLATWLPAQTKLRTLCLHDTGVYWEGRPLHPITLGFFQDMIDASPANDPLTVFYWTRQETTPSLAVGFPALYRNWSTVGIKRLMDGKMFGHRSLTHWIRNFHLYVKSLSDAAALRHIVDAIAVSFPALNSLELRVSDHAIEDYTKQFPGILSALPCLEVLGIWYWGAASEWTGPRVNETQKLQLAESWAKESPRMEWVIFEGMRLKRDTRTGQWGIFKTPTR